MRYDEYINGEANGVSHPTGWANTGFSGSKDYSDLSGQSHNPLYTPPAADLNKEHQYMIDEARNGVRPKQQPLIGSGIVESIESIPVYVAPQHTTPVDRGMPPVHWDKDHNQPGAYVSYPQDQIFKPNVLEPELSFDDVGPDKFAAIPIIEEMSGMGEVYENALTQKNQSITSKISLKNPVVIAAGVLGILWFFSRKK